MSDQSTYPPASRGLPLSDALAEAKANSPQELFSRNPEGYADQQIDAIILHMREMRLRLESTETVRHTRVKDPNRASRPKKGEPLDFDDVDFSGA